MSNKFFRTLLSAALFIATLGPCLAEERRLFILHTNDIHGYIEASDRGGLVKVAAAIETLRRTFPGEVVLFDAGDTSLGTPVSGLTHGKPTAEIIDLLDYDAVAVGNHEFNWGQKVLSELTRAFDTSVLCANLVTVDGSPAPFPGFTVIERNGVKVGVIGLVTADTYRRAPAEATAGWQFLEPAQAVRSVLPLLPADCDLIVGLTHIGVSADHKLARAVPELDLIVGGHSHTPLREVEYEGPTPIVQAGCYGEYLGVLELLVDTDLDKAKVVSYRLLRFDGESPVLEKAQEVVNRYARELEPLLKRVVAELPDPLINRPVESGYDTPMGCFIADIFRQAAHTDVAFYNRGGARFELGPGPLTVEKIHQWLPFDDPVTILETDGATLRRIVEQGTVEGEGPLSSSGLTAVIQQNKVEEILVNGRPLQENKLYTIAVTGFLAGGGDGMTSFARAEKLKRLPFTREVVLEYFEKGNAKVAIPKAGRLSPRPATP